MKIPAARVEAVLRRPDPELRGILFYGPDAGLVRERAASMVRAVCADPSDPFRIADLSAAVITSDPARLADEAAQISLMGGRRVIRVRELNDARLHEAIARLFAGLFASNAADALIVAEAGDLPSRSPLRRVFEDAPQAAAIGCYPDSGRDLAAVIRDAFTAQRIAAGREVVEFLVEHLGGDRLLTRAELEKLTLYAGEGGRIGIDDARAIVADSAALSQEEAVMAAAEGDAAALDRALSRLFQEGDAAVSVIRALLRHLHRLHILTIRMKSSGSIEETLRSARPPIFFKQQDSFRRQLARWTDARLRIALDHAAEAEFRMKLTGAPFETLCRAAMLSVAREAMGRS
jgi:DNA polymerase-3 subunit delta